jgi:hypothetical protein
MKKLIAVVITLFAMNVNAATEEFTEEEHLTALKMLLKDPGSMEVRNIRMVNNNARGVRTMCGEVNAKNSYGGYTGFSNFYVFFADTIIAVISDGSKIEEMMNEMMCRGL